MIGNKKIIRENIYLSPDNVSVDMVENIYNYYCSKYKGKCTAQNGYIIDVLRITKILSNSISRVDSTIIFDVEFEIISHIPTIGDIHNCKIFLIFKEGIFVNVEHLKIFIHNKNFEEYLYYDNNSIARYITPDYAPRSLPTVEAASRSPPSDRVSARPCNGSQEAVERSPTALPRESLPPIEAAPRSLNIGDSLVVKILGTKYSNDNKNYSCFGTIIF